MSSLPFLLMAVALVAMGIWARRNAPLLVSAHLDSGERRKRQRVLRRGGTTCLVAAAAFAAFAAVDLW